MYQKLTDTGNAQKLSIPQDAWMMHQFDNHEILRLDLKPGETIDKHANDWRIIFFVLEGRGTLIVDHSSYKMKAHDSMAVKPGLVREWLNHGINPLKLLVVKTREMDQ